MLAAIVATNAAGASVQFDPASGIDYAFDSNPPGAADDLWEGNAMERSKRLRAWNLPHPRAAGGDKRRDDLPSRRLAFSVETRL